MSDHYHYGYADERHDHRGQYAEDRHDHYDYAREHHRHYDLENDGEKAQGRIAALQDEVDGLRGQLADAFERIAALEAADTRLAAVLHRAAASHEEVRITGMAADYHLAIAEELSGAFTAFADALDDQPEPEPEEYDPGPEVDDEGGMSEYRYILPEDYERGQS